MTPLRLSPVRDKASEHNSGLAFLSIEQACRELGVSRRFLEGRIADRELKTFKPSARMVRIRRSELERWIELHSSERVA